MLIREIQPEDAACFTNLVQQVEAESEFMLMEAGERKTSFEKQRQQLERLSQQENSTIFVAEDDDGQLVGYLIVIGGNVKRKKHSAYLVIGILQNYRGQGIGTALFQTLDKWGKAHHLSRLELSVVTQNVAGIALYKKRGFDIEGTKRQSLVIDGTFYDEYYMAKLL
ncbi:RimJ/RimL family protein N-acetyltransferase [Pullulanibacillus pueri]|uniref:N-acetyltransferase domain-containing protein n=1 Tax=Pullulanibacillus pueri TaxID=1437324 RepID=A0A8J2ZWC0_9BACL|nr:GNAT family N-acetyltransferase [Pullulanibacillus pueri]MBM7680941.1 RimJ/RimL family protein N-acetyltransferase [Pullulanibacillus pueri]GGH81422.1 hypothetical protein GCM10007096_19300 [Pullulanibacillus pueri]